MIDLKFFRNIQVIFADIFKYRVSLSADQFVEMGYAERKMCLVLDIYDLIKQVKKESKVHKRLHNVDPNWKHPCDLAIKDYGLIDHQNNVQKELQFRLNSTLLQRTIAVVN